MSITNKDILSNALSVWEDTTGNALVRTSEQINSENNALYQQTELLKRSLETKATIPSSLLDYDTLTRLITKTENNLNKLSERYEIAIDEDDIETVTAVGDAIDQQSKHLDRLMKQKNTITKQIQPNNKTLIGIEGLEPKASGYPFGDTGFGPANSLNSEKKKKKKKGVEDSKIVDYDDYSIIDDTVDKK